jgi:hypothetical protein
LVQGLALLQRVRKLQELALVQELLQLPVVQAQQ